MTFTKAWIALPSEEGQETRVPVLDVYFRTVDGHFTREVFVVDSGADVSLGPRALCDLLGLAWEKGTPTELAASPRVRNVWFRRHFIRWKSISVKHDAVSRFPSASRRAMRLYCSAGTASLMRLGFTSTS